MPIRKVRFLCVNTLIWCMLSYLFSNVFIPSRWWISKVWWVPWMNRVSCWRKEPSCTSCRLCDHWQHLLLPADLSTRSVSGNRVTLYRRGKRLDGEPIIQTTFTKPPTTVKPFEETVTTTTTDTDRTDNLKTETSQISAGPDSRHSFLNEHRLPAKKRIWLQNTHTK